MALAYITKSNNTGKFGNSQWKAVENVTRIKLNKASALYLANILPPRLARHLVPLDVQGESPTWAGRSRQVSYT